MGTRSPARCAMIRIAITAAAFEAIAATLPLGSVGHEPRLDPQGNRLTWLERPLRRPARAMRGPARATAM